MLAPKVRRARSRGIGVGTFLLPILFSTMIVEAQTKKPVAKAPAKSDAPVTIPGTPPQMPAKARQGLHRTLQQQLDDR